MKSGGEKNGKCIGAMLAVADPGFGKGGDNIYKIVYIGDC